MHCGKREGYCIAAQAEDTVLNGWRTPALNTGIVWAAAGGAPESRDAQSQEGAGPGGMSPPAPICSCSGPPAPPEEHPLCPGAEMSLLLLPELPEKSLSLRSQRSNLSLKFQTALCFRCPDLSW